MKKFFKLSLMVAAAALFATSCNCYKKMAKGLDSLSVICSPEVLTLNNGKVSAEISLDIPAKYFNKKAVLRVTPVIVYQGGEVKAEPIVLQGEYIQGNNQNVSFVDGAKLKRSVSFDYTPQMRRSKLQLRIEALCNCYDCEEFVLINPETGEPITMSELETLEAEPNSNAAMAILRRCGVDVADGISTLQNEFNYAQMMESMKDDFKRVTNSVESVEISYNINSSVVNVKRLDKESVAAFNSVVAKNVENDRAKQSLSVNGYASPDGDEQYNKRLSDARSKSAEKALLKSLKEYGVEMQVSAHGEDWDGFKRLVEESDIEDKGLILQLLDQYETSSQREKALRNMSAVFGDLKVKVFPQLRRSQVVNNIELIGKSDAEMMELIESNRYMDLNSEEVLHACANLKLTNPQRVALLDFSAKKYNDHRAYNNLGVIYAKMGKDAESIKSFEMAIRHGAKSSEIIKNMTLTSIESGNIALAEKFAMSAGEDAKCAVEVAKGDYSQAVKSMSGYNAAVAYTIMGNYSSAKSSLGNNKSADAEYLRAVIASLEGDLKVAGESLKSAVAKNKSLAKKAETDVNFKNLFESGFKM